MTAVEHVTVYDSASGAWPLEGDGEGAYLLTYIDSWGGTYQGTYYSSNFELAGAKFPKAWRIQISVYPPGQVAVAGYDVEARALTIAEACGLVNSDFLRGRHPFLYGTRDTIEELRVFMERNYTQFADKVDYWLAEPDRLPTIPAGFIAKQYLWTTDYDVSVVQSTAACLRKGDVP